MLEKKRCDTSIVARVLAGLRLSRPTVSILFLHVSYPTPTQLKLVSKHRKNGEEGAGGRGGLGKRGLCAVRRRRSIRTVRPYTTEHKNNNRFFSRIPPTSAQRTQLTSMSCNSVFLGGMWTMSCASVSLGGMWSYGRPALCWGGGVYSFRAYHSRSAKGIDPHIPAMPGRSTSGFQRPGRHCVHQARHTVRCSTSHMKGGLYYIKEPLVERTSAPFAYLLARRVTALDSLFVFFVWRGVTTECNCGGLQFDCEHHPALRGATGVCNNIQDPDV